MGSANRSSTGKGSRAEVSPRFLSVGRVDQSTASNQQNTKRKPRGGFQKSGVGSPLPSLTPLAGVRSRRCALPQVCAGKCSQKGGAAASGRGEQFALCLVACWRLGLSIFTFWSLARVYKRSVQSPRSPHCPPRTGRGFTPARNQPPAHGGRCDVLFFPACPLNPHRGHVRMTPLVSLEP